MKLHRGGKEAFPALLSAIAAAKQDIFINMFIWRDDKIGRALARAILAAADRGVSVTVRKDRYGLVLELAEESRRGLLHPEPRLTERVKAGALSLLYARGQKPEVSEEGKRLYERLCTHPAITLEKDIHRADHAKYIVIDGELLFLGGINFEAKEAGKDRRGYEYGDYMIELHGREYYEALLSAQAGKPCLGARPYYFVANCKESGVFAIEEHYLTLIREAKSELLIVMAYLSPLPAFLTEILAAARRGVRVRILIPTAANFQNSTNRRAARLLLRRSGGNIEVALSPKMLHTKLLLTESILSFGSCNITKKAFSQLDEANIALLRGEAAVVSDFLASLEEEWEAARKVTCEDELSYSRLAAFFEGFLV